MSRTAKQRQMQQISKPEVIVDFIFENGLFYIAVENIGNASAFDISVQFTGSIFGVEGSKEISALELFKDITFMPPSKKIVTFLDTSVSFFKRRERTKIKTIIRCQDKYKKIYMLSIKHNLEIYRDIGYIKKL